MPRILLDENMPAGIRTILGAHAVRTVQDMGWAGITNGRLLAAAAAEGAGFDVMVTGDKNLAYQQHLSGGRLAMIVLGTTGWPTLRQHPGRLLEALAGAGVGCGGLSHRSALPAPTAATEAAIRARCLSATRRAWKLPVATCSFLRRCQRVDFTSGRFPSAIIQGRASHCFREIVSGRSSEPGLW